MRNPYDNYIVEEYDVFEDWVELIKKIEKLNKEEFIFRGHSNDYKQTEEWKIVSSFNRKYNRDFYDFGTYLRQQLCDSFFEKVYSKYKFIEIEKLYGYNLLQRLYYFQHYGIPTCLIDFTKNPLVATYFAIANVLLSNSGLCGNDNNLTLYPSDCFVTIYAINIKKIMTLFDIKNLNNSCLLKYQSYENNHAFIGCDLNPMNQYDYDQNKCPYNLKEQESVFILFDNKGGNSWSLIDWIKSSALNKGLNSDEKLVYKFKLNYNAITKRQENNKMTLFNHLEREKKTGQYLFDDIQGLKYDLNFFHH